MTDFFAVLHAPRRPWLDPDLLKAKFLALSADLHPDRAHGGTGAEKAGAQDRFTELNSAYNCLRSPRDRLQHLLELESGSKPPPVEQVPPELMDLFFGVGSACREADGVLQRKAEAASPLLQVNHFGLAQQGIEKLAVMQKQLLSRVEALFDRLRQLDTEWMRNKEAGVAQPATTTDELAQIYRLLGYFNRWSSQVQERIVLLSI